MATQKQTESKTIPFADIEAALGSASEHFHDTAAHARESAKVAAGNVKHAVNTGIFNAGFGFSYGVVFTSVFLTELLPENSSLRKGLEQGADAALEAHARRRGIVPGEFDEEEISEAPEQEAEEAEVEAETPAPRPRSGKSRSRSRSRAKKEAAAAEADSSAA
ncbi:hypothetical protein DB346_20015 [Verrucomicrobia bacterium LW23]|nr:hypothetical protein DB346_20015 [Verrucomicrobia bacterium LW23]